MNTPNKITLSRLLLLPIIIFFYLADFIPYGRLVATIVFIIACLTDFIDGYLARKYNQVTDLGKFFDTIADKVLIMTGLILIIAAPVTGSAPIVFPTYLGVICVIIILARELIVSALRQIAASKGIVLAADMGGKVKATVQYISVSLYMFYAFFITDIHPLLDGETANKVSGIISFILMIILIAATILTIYSGASYLIRNRKVFKTDKNNNFVNHDEIDDLEDEEENEETSDADNSEEQVHYSDQAMSEIGNNEESQELTEEQKDAMRVFFKNNKVTATLLQQEMGLSTYKSSKIVAELESLGLVSKVEGRNRKLLITEDAFNDAYNKKN